MKAKDGSKRCRLLFKSANQLREHQVFLKHNLMKKPKKSSLKNQEKQLKIDEVFATKEKEASVKKVNLPEEDINEETDAEEKGMISRSTYFFIEMRCTLSITEIGV